MSHKSKFDVLLNKLKTVDTLNETLNSSPNTGGLDLVITHGDSILGQLSGNGSTGGDVNFLAGNSVSGDGGDAVFAGGTGNNSGGDAFLAGGLGVVSGGDVFIDGGLSTTTDDLSGDVFIQNLRMPRADSSAGSVIATDGAGNLNFINAAAEVRATKEIFVADSPYIVTSGDFTVRCNTISGAIMINIPKANDVVGRILNIKSVNNMNTATVSGDGVEKIDGGNIFMLTSLNESVTIQANGTNWDII